MPNETELGKYEIYNLSTSSSVNTIELSYTLNVEILLANKEIRKKGRRRRRRSRRSRKKLKRLDRLALALDTHLDERATK